MSAQVEAEQQQIDANKKFAMNMMERVQQDAKQIEADVSSRDVSDIETKDQDATQLSDEIQKTAEAVDDDLLQIKDKLTNAGITKLKAKKTNLGETTKHLQFPDDTGESYRTRLTNVENEAQEAVESAQQEAAQFTDKKEALDQQLNDMSSAAKVGMKQLKQAESQLHRDL